MIGMLRRSVFAIAMLATALSVGTARAERIDVIELFTSQGCSSCPPADAVIAEMADRDDVLTLSFNVDYWDYLGWKDTLANPQNTARQKAYAHFRGDRAVYTPQAIVNGMMHAVGSDRMSLKNALQSTGDKLDKRAIEISARREGDEIVVDTGKTRGVLSWPKPATVWMVIYDKSRTVKIERGENRGRTITYANVVKRIEPIGTWRGKAARFRAPVPEAGVSCAVFLQEGDGRAPGPILAAAKVM